MSTIGIDIARPAPHRGPARADGVGVAGRIRRGVALLRTWQQRRRQRHALLSLDERLLRDIGIGRDEARREAAKPFWRA